MVTGLFRDCIGMETGFYRDCIGMVTGLFRDGNGNGTKLKKYCIYFLNFINISKI